MPKMPFFTIFLRFLPLFELPKNIVNIKNFSSKIYFFRIFSPTQIKKKINILDIVNIKGIFRVYFGSFWVFFSIKKYKKGILRVVAIRKNKVPHNFLATLVTF